MRNLHRNAIILSCATLTLGAVARAQDTASKARDDALLLDGEWSIVKQQDGRGRPSKELNSLRFIPSKSLLVLNQDDQPGAFAFKIDPTKSPKQIDLGVLSVDGFLGLQLKGIYTVSPSKLQLAFGKRRPSSFRPNDDDGSRFVVLERSKRRASAALRLQCTSNLRGIQQVVFAYAQKHRRIPESDLGSLGKFRMLLDSTHGKDLSPSSLVCKLGDETPGKRAADGSIQIEAKNVSYRLVSPSPRITRRRVLAYCPHDHGKGDRIVVETTGKVTAMTNDKLLERLKREGVKPEEKKASEPRK